MSTKNTFPSKVMLLHSMNKRQLRLLAYCLWQLSESEEDRAGASVLQLRAASGLTTEGVEAALKDLQEMGWLKDIVVREQESRRPL